VLQALLDQVVRGGGEGLMLHKGSAAYRSGRSDDLLKLKPFDDAEARVVGYKQGKGQWQGMTGALILQTPEGQQFALGTGLPTAMRRSPPPLGSWITYRYQGLHEKSGLPRFARFLRLRQELDYLPAAAQ
jgi:DNA ligase-1